MTDPLSPPPKKNPQKAQRVPTLPPGIRSRAAMGLTAAAAEGRFMLQHCAECGTVQYPPRDACCSCLSTKLPWRDTDPSGELIAVTVVRASPNLYFRDRTPWRTGTVRLAAGPSVVCHVHGDCEKGAEVRLINRLDRAGQGVLMALPKEGTPNMADDPELRELTADPKHRRVLITDARQDNAPALARALLDAGAAQVFVGEAEGWRPYPQRAKLAAMEHVTLLPLDVTDTTSVKELAGEIGGKTDILINNARFVRPGGLFERGDTTFAREEMEVNYLGLMRLAQAFGPAMRSRGADGVNNAVAWVNLLSVHALSNDPAYGSFAASNAAALSLSQALRAELRPGGVRVMNVFSGPTEDDWHQAVPPPKVTPNAVARAVVAGLRDGLEEVWCGDVARDLVERWRQNPKVLERELTGGEG
ncbi:SDR family NAD(P)-dependent oxidoreductase [Tranquillimonas alkanivorans]|uniref:Short-chain dehydrogenase n=1 Tax=Tranquillimonas alkanivorans TaxID=441119 RepID=A0A1I5UUU7_9RHOB|nr:SDR family NAD(P)-dependent oxidoreductase [Tranquillimonas alkanivorans]SFP98992.1 Short-chain dehydrogenase [Tranquillimonas alkanivorans]